MALLTGRRHLRAAAINSAWLLSEKLLVGVTFVVMILVARYLGPNSFGALNYAIAFVAIVGTLNYLGLSGLVVREIVNDPSATAEIVGTVLWLKFVASLCAVVACILGAFLLIDEPRSRELVLLISLGLPFEAVFAFRLFFEAKVRAGPMVAAVALATLLGAGARVLAIVAGAPLWVFGVIIPLQTGATAIAITLAYSRSGQSLRRLEFKLDRAKQLLRLSWPLIISQAGAVLYLKLDQFMLGRMVSIEAVGIYAVAARLSELWYVVPAVLAGSIAPRLFQLRKADVAAYDVRLKQAFGMMFWLGVAVALPISILATPLVQLLYGDQYRTAGAILAIHIWACPAIFMGAVLQKWFLAEDMIAQVLVRSLVGAALAVTLNLLLIPRYGGVGAAISTLAAYTGASYLACFLSPKTFAIGVRMTEAILWPGMLLINRLRRLRTRRGLPPDRNE